MVTNQKTHEKVPVFGYCLIPRVSLVDPQLTVTVSSRMMAEGAEVPLKVVISGQVGNGKTMELARTERFLKDKFLF